MGTANLKYTMNKSIFASFDYRGDDIYVKEKQVMGRTRVQLIYLQSSARNECRGTGVLIIVVVRDNEARDASKLPNT